MMAVILTSDQFVRLIVSKFLHGNNSLRKQPAIFDTEIAQSWLDSPLLRYIDDLGSSLHFRPVERGSVEVFKGVFVFALSLVVSSK